ncbi:hypothetical protein ABIB62_004072 [Mucilaginibacter sp. UYP25]|uniref:RagB/SusD family nutrient uptake outer membrane protein n=1 Tax=unclassified Mucilaginibacter TaxID=2617802 RepID=UPI0033988764
MKLKNIKNRQVFLIAFLVISIAACKRDDFLNVPPKGIVTDDATFSSETNADLFVNDIYNNLPDLNNNTEMLDQWTDNSMTGASNQPGQAIIRNNSINPNADGATNGPVNAFRWETVYGNIRKCNVFLQQADKNKGNFSETFYKSRVAEIKFLRAFYYSLLLQNYGGVPLISTPLNNLDGSDIFVARSTFDETLAFIEVDCDAAAADLPATTDNQNTGRATKGAALTLKGAVDLFAASPLANTTNDKAKWAKAAAANLAVMNLGTYGLFPDYGAQFLAVNNWNSETIFARGYALPSKGHKREGILGPVFVHGGQQAWGNIVPTQGLVDDYEMDNGKPINDPGSGYDDQHPYVNREQRFYKSIVYDGSTWQGEPFLSRIGGGNQIDLGSTSDITNTGYNGRKTLDESILGQTSLGTSPGTSNYQFYRYAEVLLSYAEAQNEAVGPDQSVYDAVKKVRARVALPEIPAGLSQEKMRENIRRERRVELAFEDKRWYDIRRWDITTKGPAVLTAAEYGMKITVGGGGVLTYTPVKVFQNTFSQYMNWLPIPQRILNQNTKLKQNPGY